MNADEEQTMRAERDKAFAEVGGLIGFDSQKDAWEDGYMTAWARVESGRERVDALTAALRGILDWEGDHAEHLGQCAVDLKKWPCPFERARRLLSESVGED